MSQIEGEALLRSVLENPFDDAPRLIYSDWLEENGDEQQARLIRLQVAMSRLRSTPTPDPNLIEYVRSFYPDDERYQSALALEAFHLGKVTKMVRGFISEHAIFIEEFMRGAKALFERFPIVYVSVLDRYPLFSPQENTYRWLTDRFYQRSIATIPREIFDRFPPEVLSVDQGVASFCDTVEAEDAFSQASVSLGRHLAGLPPLKMV